jgi:dynein heavy chain
MLSTAKGNMLLIGIGGSGKQSLTRLVSYILSHNIYQLHLNKSHDHEAFQEDLKTILWKTGVEGKHLIFLLTDNQIAKESFLEDINPLLNIGEVSGLYTQGEIEKKLIDEIRPEAVDKLKIPDSKDELYAFFMKRVRELLHTVLCMSPMVGVLRIRCRMFPSLVNCTTMNWFSKWPERALMSVSKKLLEQIDLPEVYREPLAFIVISIIL